MPVFTENRVPLPLGHLLTQKFINTDEAIKSYAASHLTGGPGDAIFYFLPHHLHLWRSLRRGELPHWEPYTTCGHPFLAESEPAVLYPFKLFCLLADELNSFSLVVIADFIVRELGMVMLLRIFGVRVAVACAGGLAYALSGYFTVWTGTLSMTGTTSWLPWLVFLYWQAVRRRRLAYAIVGALITAVQLFAGHTQMAFYNMLAVGLLTAIFAQSPRHRRKTMWFAVVMLFGGILLAAPQLLPSTSLHLDSGRFERDDILTLAPTQLILYFSPQTFGDRRHYHGWNYESDISYCGTLLLFFACSALWRRQRFTLPFAIILVFGFFLTYSRTFNAIFNTLPGMSQIFHLRATVLVQFSLVVLGALGLESERGRQFLTRVCLFGFLYALALFAAGTTVSDRLQPFLPLLPLLLLTLVVQRMLRFPRLLRWLPLCAAFAAGSEVLAFGLNERSFAPRELFDNVHSRYIKFARDYPHLYRIRNHGEDALFTGARLWFGVYGISGYQTFGKLRYGNLRELTEGPEQTLYSPRLNNLFSVHYIISPDTLPLPRTRHGGRFANVYYNASALPRAGLYYRTVRTAGDAAAQLVIHPDFPIERVLLLDPATPQLPNHPNGHGEARITVYEHQRVVIACTSSAPGWLLLTDAYDPWWRARVNGSEVLISRGHYVFRAVPVPAGSSTVEFFYYPLPFYAGLLVAAAAAALMLLLLRPGRLVRSAGR